MLSIVAHGIFGTAYRRDVVIDEEAGSNGDINVLKDIRHLLSKQYGDGTPTAGWCFHPACSGMWISHIERVFDSNYQPAYVMISFLLPCGYKLRKEALQRIEYSLLVNHEDYVQQSVSLFEANWSFLRTLGSELQEYLLGESSPCFTGSISEETAYWTGDITSMLGNIWNPEFRRFGIIFCGKRILNQNKDFIAIDDNADLRSGNQEDGKIEVPEIDDESDSSNQNVSENSDSKYAEPVCGDDVEAKEEKRQETANEVLDDEVVETDVNGDFDADDASAAVNDSGLNVDESGIPTSYTSKWLKENTSIKSWLSFFLTIVLLSGIFNAIYPIATQSSSFSAFLNAVDVILGLLGSGIAIYTVYAFIQRKPNAVYSAIMFVVIMIMTNIIDILGNENVIIVIRLIRILWGGGLIAFLLNSKQVKEVIPLPYRKLRRLDRGILVVLTIVLIVCASIAFVHKRTITRDREYDEIVMLLEDIEDDERTDGRIIFTIPEGFMCELNDSDSEDDSATKVFSIVNDEAGIHSELCSFYDSDTSSDNFEIYWSAWSNVITDEYDYSCEDEGVEFVNGNRCQYKIVKVDVDGIPVYWRFYVMFNSDTGKCCVVSCIDKEASTSYVASLLNSIRFSVT